MDKNANEVSYYGYFFAKKKKLSLEVTILESYISSCISGSPSHFYFTVVKNSLFCQNVKESKRARGGGGT